MNAAGTTANGAQGGVIGGNGNAQLTAGAMTNSGQVNALGDARVNAASLNNDGGSVTAGGALTTTVAGAMSNRQGTVSGSNTSVAAQSLDNSAGLVEGNQLAVSTVGDLLNRGGQINQYGPADTSIQAGGTLDNTQGTIGANGQNLSILANSLVNDSGKIAHAGTGALSVSTQGALSNAQGAIQTNGNLTTQAGGALGNAGGRIEAAGAHSTVSVTAASADNTAGRIINAGDGLTQVSIAQQLLNANSTDGQTQGLIGGNGALQVNAGTLINHAQVTTKGDATLSAQTLNNDNGSVTAGGTLTTAVAGAISNRQGALSAGTTQTLRAASLDNTAGHIDGDALQVATTGDLLNRAGSISQYGTTDATVSAGGTLDNTQGSIAANGANLTVAGQSIVNDAGKIQHAGNGNLAVTSAGDLSNAAGAIQTNGNLAVQAGGALGNAGGLMEAAGAHSVASVTAASADNTAGRIINAGDGLTQVSIAQQLLNANSADGQAQGLIGGNGALQVTAATLVNHTQISASGDTTVQAQTLNNDSGTMSTGGTLAATVAGAASNRQGTLSGASLGLTAATLDNTAGRIEGNALQVATTGDLLNQGGTIQQYGTTDTTVSAGGALDNTQGMIAANGANLSVSGQSIVNDGGKLQHAGTGTLAVTSQGALSNVNGSIQTNGALQAQAASLDNTQGVMSAQHAAALNTTGDLINRQGTLYGGGGLALTSGGQIDNTGGSAQTFGDLSVTATGALTNADGILAANGKHGQVSVSAASADNTRGVIGNSGDGATTVSAATTLVNTAGRLGGNGDVTVNAQTLTNTTDGTTGALLAAGGALNLNVTTQIDNTGSTLYGGNGLTFHQANATLNNAGGKVLGGTDVQVDVAALNNLGGAIQANRDIAVAGAVSGSGEMTAGRNLALDVVGDYTNDAANRLRADGDMRVAAAGTLTNTGTLAAVGGLTVQGTDVVNAAGADMAGATTTVTASNSLANAGRIEGDTVQTTAPTTINTGTVIGNAVTVQGTDIVNSGASALMAAVQQLNLYATNSVQNLDGANLYSAGNMQIARDGTRDTTTGLLANQTNLLLNRSATIEADGDLDVAANQVQNIRTSIVTQPGTPVTTASQTLTTWFAGLTGIDQMIHYSLTFPNWSWSNSTAPVFTDQINALRTPLTVTVDKSTVSNLNTANQTLSFTTAPTEAIIGQTECTPGPCTRALTSNSTQYYQSLTDNGTTYSITFWPDWNPATQIRPDQVRQANFGHDYNEISRTSTTTTATDQLVSATPASLMQSGGTMRINSNGGNILNQSSTMAAGGDLVRSAVGGTIQDTGTVLQQTVATQDTSTFYWHQSNGPNSDTQIVAYPSTPTATTTVMALPAIASANQAVQSAGQTIQITTVNALGQTVTGSGVSGGSATGVQVSGASGTGTTPSTIHASSATAVSASGTGAATVGTGSVATTAGQATRPQTLGTASGGIPNLTLPTNGLYHYQTAPGATFLIATDPRFTQYSKFISSDYMLGQLGLDPMMTEKRLGDGLYEEKLIRDQVTQLTGRTYLAGYSNNLDEYQALMDSGVSYAKAFNLAPGIGLTADQMAQLTTDMVWLVSQDVTLPDGTHQTVLVPKVYLAQANTVDLQDTGALVTGNTVSLNASGDLANSGKIVGDVATQVVGNNIVNRGLIGGAGTTVVAAQQDVQNLGGQITGTDTLVSAGRDVINASQTITNVTKLANGNSASATGIGAVAAISATNNVGVLAGRDINLMGGNVSAGNNALLGAGRDLNLGTAATGTTQDATAHGGQDTLHDQTTVGVGSVVQAGGSVVAVAGRDATLTSSAIQAGGDATLLAGRNTTVTAGMDTHTASASAFSNKASQFTQSSYDETASGSAVQAGNNATIGAGQTAASTILQAKGITPVASDNAGTGNLAILGSAVTTGGANGGGGAAKLAATGDVTVGTVTEQHSSQSWSHTESSGFLSSEKTTTQSSQQQTNAVGSLVSADSVTASAGRDLTVSGSTVASTNDVNMAAGNNLTIGSAQSTSESHFYQESTKTGFGATGSGISYGSRDQKDTVNDSSVTQTGSLVGSTNGSVNLQAGNKLQVTGSNVIAAKDVTGVGADVTIDASQGTQHHDETHEVKQTGVTLGVSGGPIGAAINAGNKINSATQSQDGRASALWGIAAGRDLYDAQQLATAKDATATSGVAVTVSFGSSQSKQTLTQDSTTHTGSSVTAGGTASFQATGKDADGNATAGNLNIVGSDITARDVNLQAKQDVNLIAATDTNASHSTNKSSSGSIGVSYGIGQGMAGVAVSVSASSAKGNSDSTSATQTNSHIDGSQSVSIQSGNDTNLQGATVSGGKVVADVGGDLNIASVQDTGQTRASQQSVGGGITVSMGGASGSASASKGNASGNYANVSEQSGIYAGDGGYDINVKGNTDLKGAVIASNAAPDKNSLATGTLSYSDIQNHSEYSATSFGVSGGGAVGSPPGQSNSGPGSGKNTSGVNPMIPQSESGSQDGVARAAVADGTIQITNTANQKQDVAGLSRDTANANTQVGNNPDVANILSKQSDMMAAAQAAGEAVAKTVGDIASAKRQAALDNAKAAHDAGNTALESQYRAEAEQWDEGGSNRAALQAAGGALVAGLGGGNALAGAAGAGAASLAGGKLNDLSDVIAGNASTGNANLDQAIGNLVANIAAGGIGAIVGGGSGAATAANVDRFNRQLHPTEQQWIKDNAKQFAQQLNGGQIPTDAQIADAEQRLAQQGFRQVQNGVGGQWDQAASSFLSQAHGMLSPDASCLSCGPGYMFQATAAQKANPDMYAGYLPQDRINNFYYTNGLVQPSATQLSAANAKDVAARQQIQNLTIDATAAAGLIALAPGIAGVGATTAQFCVLNPNACLVASGTGGALSGVADAAGQQYLNHTIRPGEVAFATLNGMVTTPIGMSTGIPGNIVLGALGSAANATFQNLYYGDTNSTGASALLGSVFGGFGAYAGSAVQNAAGAVFPKYAPGVPALLQVPSATAPLIGVGAGAVVQGGGSFVPSVPTQPNVR
ncbi:hemagglutinin repeat-containing protein [Cupriavidus metallidurans]|uniref:hemagglutinin repeat-containing protein n=1 Tax=Cupriavidus metallidurans TaxID=119219 RepID=UPI001CC998BC|nr:hemagglutinin repeat-containing protein [Cupriavidus metallidurans]UBM09481.1 hemagglutinin repeat-containing protein [Cupriavidus metallidurans]